MVDLPFRDIDNKVIYVTGGTSGIGKSIAKCCLDHGAKVIITGRNVSNLESALNELKENSDNIYGHIADVSNHGQVNESISQTLNFLKFFA